MRKWAPLTVLTLLILAAGRPLANFTVERANEVTEPQLGARYSQQTLHSLLVSGQTVFVDYTADWCITCKVNEQNVLKSDYVQTLFKDQNVTLLIADWTKYDESIRAELESFGRAGVPMYLLYFADQPNQPMLLPELLTTTALEKALLKREL